MDFQRQYGIAIDPAGLTPTAARDYTRKVNEHLTWIYRTRSGRILLASIRFHGRPVTIKPYTKGDCNSSGGGRTVGGQRVGTVSYSPDTFSLHGACSATRLRKNRGLYWDEILFHELVHVLRWVSGKWSKSSLDGALQNYDDSEEFNAVLLTNIYISDRSNKIKSGLRRDHKGFDDLEPALAQPWGFFTSGRQTFDLIQRFVTENPGIAVRLANDIADAPFNPLADYYADKERAQTLSRNALPRELGAILGSMAQTVGL